jgi:regulator of sigma E protease
MTFLIVVIVFGGMVFLHEFGHFLAARFFKIEIEEFGFGFPPRVLRFWREGGWLTIAGQRIKIPANFDLPFDTQSGALPEVKASADLVNGGLVLRTIELLNPPEEKTLPENPQPEFTGNAETDKRLLLDQLTPIPNPPRFSELFSKLAGFFAPRERAPQPRGAQEITGQLTSLVQGTEFTLNALPIGGFVRPKGENDPNVMDGLAAANPWQRLGVLFAGPFMNLLTAVVVASILVAQTGISVPGKVLIESVMPDSPAQLAGIQAYDQLVRVGGQPVSTLDEARKLIRASLDLPLEMVVLRNDQEFKLTATPLSSRPAEQGALGVGLSYPRRSATIGEILGGGFMYTGAQAFSILYLPVGLMQGAIAPSDARLIGLKGIYDIFGQAVERDTQSRQATPAASTAPGQPQPSQQPTNYILGLVAMLSVSLAVFNLLPIPALDGGRILFTLPEILFRRRIPYKLENVINGVAFLMLIALMIFINAMDFINPANIKLP